MKTQMQSQQKLLDSLVHTAQALKEQLSQAGSASEPAGQAFSKSPVSILAPPVSFTEDSSLQQTRLALAQPGQTPLEMQKQLDLQKKQIDVLNKMIRLLAKQLEQQSPIVNQMQTQVATLDARTKQAAQRDQELANGVTNLTEQFDFFKRYGPQLPGPLKQLFLPSYTNETPLSIYSTFAFGYSRIVGNAAATGRPATPGQFYFGEFSPDFFLKLNDWIFFEGEISVGANGSVTPTFGQADFFVTDWLTISAGRFVAPIGWYNERMNNPWINKLPGDAPGGAPLLWLQVLPPMSLMGVQARGAFYLGTSPLKMEYAAFISNGLNLTPATAGSPTVSELANLENMENTFNVIGNEKAFGGRLGLWWPEMGLEGGISGMYNGDYLAGGFENSMSLGAVDLNYRKGNWDIRGEYGINYQQTADFIGNNIRRQGFYGQIAYRPWNAANRYLQKVEVIYRYSYVNFQGIDPTALDLTTFATPIDVPVRRQQNAFGIDYWIYPRMVLQVAYQINDESGFHLHDNNFMTQLAWGW